MKKIILIACLVAFATQGMFAQEAATKGIPIEGYSAKSPAEQAKDAADKLNATVQLSAEQYNKVLLLNKDFYSQPVAGQGNLPPAKRANDLEEKIKAVLTPEQQQKLIASRPK